jgi:hypothetical protein
MLKHFCLPCQDVLDLSDEQLNKIGWSYFNDSVTVSQHFFRASIFSVAPLTAFPRAYP